MGEGELEMAVNFAGGSVLSACAHGDYLAGHGAMDARGLGGGLMDVAAPVATEPGRQTLAWPRDEWISARQLERLFGDAGPREITVYHVGRLAEDRELSPRMNRTADLAMRLGCPTNVEVTIRPWSVHAEYGLGLGFLTQKRLGPGVFEYRIQKRAS